MTVAELRAALARWDDEAEVWLGGPVDGGDDSDAISYVWGICAASDIEETVYIA